jgi:hypothetical protein
MRIFERIFPGHNLRIWGRRHRLSEVQPIGWGIAWCETPGGSKKQNELNERMMKTMLLLTLGLSLSGLLTRAADTPAKPAAPAAPAAPTTPTLPEQYKKYDKNGNGKLDEDERAAMLKDREAEILKKYDKNGNGKLDDDEREAMRADRRKLRDEAIAKRQAEQQKKQPAQEEKK